MKVVVDFSETALSWDKKTRLSPDWKTFAECLAGGILANQPTGNSVKMVGWCFLLHEDKRLELDDADFKTLYDLIEGASAGAILKGQLLMIMDRAKDAAKKAE